MLAHVAQRTTRNAARREPRGIYPFCAMNAASPPKMKPAVDKSVENVYNFLLNYSSPLKNTLRAEAWETADFLQKAGNSSLRTVKSRHFIAAIFEKTRQ
jgi:hypothetical protein